MLNKSIKEYICHELTSSKLLAFAIFSFLLVSKLAGFAIPLVLKYIIDALQNKESLVFYGFGAVSFAVLYFLLNIVNSSAAEFREYLAAILSQKILKNISTKLFSQYCYLTIDFFSSKKLGALVRDFDRGTRGVQFFATATINVIVPAIIELAIVIFYFVNNYRLEFAFTVAVFSAIYIAYTVRLAGNITAKRSEWIEQDSKLATQLHEISVNMNLVKASCAEKREINNFKEIFSLVKSAAVKSQSAHSILSFGQQFIIAIGMSFTLVLAIYEVQRGGMTIGDLVLVNAIMIQIFAPVGFIGAIYRDLKQSVAEIERLNPIIQNEKENNDSALSINGVISDRIDLYGDIVFSGVNFNYDGRNEGLNNISIKIMKNSKTAIVGPSGSGKSTIAHLLLKLYPVSSGKITIGGASINEISVGTLRKSIAYAAQETQLFNDSFLSNIKYGNWLKSVDDVIAVAKASEIDNVIKSKEGGYNYIIGEQGGLLSGGERQRLGIARALLSDASIFIFDEATAFLDLKTERKITDNIESYLKNKTRIYIAHRLSTIADADQIIVMNAGRVAEVGTHEQLIAKGGIYKEMWDSQEDLCGA